MCKQHFLSEWLDPNFTPPNITIDAHGHRVYSLNDQSLSAFILRHISQQDFKAVAYLDMSCTIYAELRRQYEQLGDHAHMLLIDRILKMEFIPGTHITQTWDEIDTLIRKIKVMGPLTWNKFRTLAAIKASGRHYKNLQLAFHSMTKQPTFMMQDIVNRLIEEDNHICNYEAQGFLPTVTTLASQTVNVHTCARLLCSHCKCTGHYAEFCIQPGGKMAGHMLKEAKVVYCASLR
jgi:hypothetical protein